MILLGFNTDLRNQMTQLENILSQNKELYSFIKKASGLGLQNYYIGAGCIAQTVWNYQSGLELTHGISDIDFVYYDKADLSYEAENAVIERIKSIITPCSIKLDIKNQARVHLWYKERFGYDIKPYDSVESAIGTWPTTATSIGVRLENNQLKVYAPFGLNDLFGMIVRANKTQITEEIFNIKVQKWIAKWPSLTVIPW
jgi:hypothetical protein